jgi:hypothetical protein
MAAGFRVRKEEYTTLGDFIRTSFVRDQPAILVRFPKMNAAYLTAFTAKLTEVKTLESGLVLTEQQKNATASLYAEATVVNEDLNFLISYLKRAKLNTTEVSKLKRYLSISNIEGAVLQMESVKQYVVANSAALIAEGMAATFVTGFDAHKVSLTQKNALQNSVMNARKVLTDANVDKYDALYNYIADIADAGKLVFAKSIVKDEYNITKVISRMRAGNGGVKPPKIG